MISRQPAGTALPVSNNFGLKLVYSACAFRLRIVFLNRQREFSYYFKGDLMNRSSIGFLTVTLMLLGGSITFAGSPAGPQVSTDRSDIKADSAHSSADEKEVKRLSEQLAQATVKTHQAHSAYVQKTSAREAAVKSYGAKDPRAAQASKDEAAAKQEWETSIKAEQQIAAQRKAAIAKLQTANTAYSKDVHKLAKDEQGHPKPATKATSTQPKK
jgi:chromosome segregation ATPase